MLIAEPAVNAWTGLPLIGPSVSGGSLHGEPAVRQPNARFAGFVATNQHITTLLGDLPGLLLQAAQLAGGIGHPVLMPLWAEEGLHRAYAMLRLLDLRASHDPGRPESGLTGVADGPVVHSLASAYRSLATADERAIVPCSTSLREVGVNLGALFGGEGTIVRTIIERLSLPAYKRRALVLAASELLLNALTHAFRDGARDGRIELTLRRLGDGRACLRVADNGAGSKSGHPDVAVSIAGVLAGLLEADLAYRRTAEWTTVAEIIFPVEITARARIARIDPTQRCA